MNADRTDPSPVAPERNRAVPATTGLVLVVVGLVFLLEGTLGLDLHNWWAIFIAVPGAIALARAYATYERNGRRLDAAVAREALVGAVPLTVAAIFLLRLDWGGVWPVFLIIAGLGALSGTWGEKR